MLHFYINKKSDDIIPDPINGLSTFSPDCTIEESNQLRKFLDRCSRSTSLQQKAISSLREIIDWEAKSKIKNPLLEIPNKSPNNEKIPEIQSVLELRFICLKGVYSLDPVSMKATKLVCFGKKYARFGVDFRRYEFETFRLEKKGIHGAFYVMQMWFRGQPYAKVILTQENGYVYILI